MPKVVSSLLAATTAAALIGAVLWFGGGVTVLDPAQQVLSAQVVGGGQVQRLQRLPFNVFFVIPEIEGELEVRCRDSLRANGGYVTPNLHTQVRVGPRCTLD